MFRSIFCLFLLCFILASCMPDRKKTTQTTGTTGGLNPTNTNTSTTGHTPEDGSIQNTGNTVHIFKYTGRKFGRTEATSSFLMAEELAHMGIPHQDPLTGFNDGKTYEKQSGADTGDIIVFPIDSGALALSEQLDFCQCTLQKEQKICVPISYTSSGQSAEPAPSCQWGA